MYSLVRSSVRLHGNILQFHLFLPPEATQPLPPMVDMSMVNTDMVDTDMVDTEVNVLQGWPFFRGSCSPLKFVQAEFRTVERCLVKQ